MCIYNVQYVLTYKDLFRFASKFLSKPLAAPKQRQEEKKTTVGFVT